MSILINKTIEEVSATGVRFYGNIMYISLSDGREISVPLNKAKWLKWLLNATSAQRENWSLEPGGFAIYWTDLDDGIEISHLLETKPL